MKLSVGILFFTITTFCFCDNDSILKTVIVIFRHGDRNIISGYPNDPYAQMKWWPGGYGQLTNKGKLRHFRLGQWYRERYANFLSKPYSYYDIKVISTDVDRTLMSAAAHLAGLYSPRTVQIWDPTIDWQPIPIHTTPLTLDAVLYMEKPCPKYNTLYEEFLKSPLIQGIQNQLKGTYDYINQYGGGNITDLLWLQDFYDLLYIEEQAGYKLPEWLNKIYPKVLSPYAAFFLSMGSYTPDLARLKTGPLINEIVQHFRNATKHKDASFQKYRIYSAHDTTLGNLLQTLGAYNSLSPPYAASVIFELRQNINTKNHFVNVLYKNNTIATLEPYNLEIKDCEFDCEFNKFVEVLKHVTIDSETWEKECNAPEFEKEA